MASLLTLPTELILEILSSITDENPEQHGRTYQARGCCWSIPRKHSTREMYAVALVCKRLNSIASALLFREIAIGDPAQYKPRALSLEKLCRSLKENPSLGSLVRVLLFEEEPYADWEYQEIMESYIFPNVREVVVFHDGCWEDHDHYEEWDSYKHKWCDRFPALLSSCPQLSKLEFRIQGIGNPADRSARTLLAKLKPWYSNLTELSLQCVKDFGRRVSRIEAAEVEDFTLADFSSLQRLSIDWTFMFPSESVWEPDLRLCANYRRLPQSIKELEIALPSCKEVFASDISPLNPRYKQKFGFYPNRFLIIQPRTMSINDAGDTLIFGNFAAWLLEFAKNRARWLPRLREIIFSGDGGVNSPYWADNSPLSGWVRIGPIADEIRKAEIDVKVRLASLDVDRFCQKWVEPVETLYEFWQMVEED